MVSNYPSWNLRMVNLVIGMAKGDSALPTVLHEEGYQLHYIEREFVNSQEQSVTPEVILTSERAENALLFEWKAGGNLDRDQLERYAAVTAQDLGQRALVPRPAERTHDVVVVVGDKADICANLLNDWAIPFPLIEQLGNQLRLVANRFTLQQLNEAFSPSLMVNWDHGPLSYVQVDPDTPSDVLVDKVGRFIISVIVKREPRVRLGEVVEAVLPPIASTGPRYVKCLRPKLEEVVERLVANEFQDYVELRPSNHSLHEPWLRRRDSDLSIDMDRRTQKYKALERQLRQAIERERNPQQQFEY